MCGICGFTGVLPDARSVASRMCRAIAHRGPDGEGIYARDGITLGHRRLALLDVEGGAQPMLRDGGAYALVFNGEIYNFQELRAELELAGWTFVTHSDTEVLLVGYLAWGTKVLERLRGMFAFAIWDGLERQLFCARDPFGIKPFYYTQQKGQFIFASEIKAILEHPSYERELNQEALAQYLCYEFNPLEETFFKGVFQLPQGYYALVDDQGIMRKERYVSLALQANPTLRRERAVELLDEAVRESVRYHNIADAEVGCFLSSGVDSSYLAACLAHENPAAKTFTVGFDEYGHAKEERDEVSWASDLAERIGVTNAHHRISEAEYWDAVPKVQWFMDEPCGDPSAVALYFVNGLAATQVKAVLSGDGADELFGGYPLYRAPLEARWLSWCPKPLLRIGAALLRKSGCRGANFLARATTSVEQWYYTNANGVAFSPEERARILKGDGDLEDPRDVVQRYYARTGFWDEPARMQYVDMNCWMVGDILLKNDKMAMAHSIESRVPFLDKGVWNVARELPRPLRVSRSETKVALRAAAERMLPRNWARKEKLGFPVPLAQWLRDEQRVQQVRIWFTGEDAARFFEVEELERLIEEHQQGKDRSRKIWIVLMFLVWYRLYFGDRTPSRNSVSQDAIKRLLPLLLVAKSFDEDRRDATEQAADGPWQPEERDRARAVAFDIAASHR